MKQIILLHQGIIQHYRVVIYNRLEEVIKAHGYKLVLFAQGIQKGHTHSVNFSFYEFNLSTISIIKRLNSLRPSCIIFFVNMKNLYLFPVLLAAKSLGVKTIYWGHARDLQDPNNIIKNSIYYLEHKVVDAILLYAECLKKYVRTTLHAKVFIANNTLNLMQYDNLVVNREEVLSKYKIKTKINIICLGRMQKRKRIDDLVQAFELLDSEEVGLVLAGPDPDRLLVHYTNPRIYKPGAVYGEEAVELLTACDLYCLPGSIGLSIVDAFYCHLPLVTENVRHGPEICFFKNKVNGFMVPKGDIKALSKKLSLLLSNNDLRQQFAFAARHEVESNAHIDTMCAGFLEAIRFLETRA